MRTNLKSTNIFMSYKSYFKEIKIFSRSIGKNIIERCKTKKRKLTCASISFIVSLASASPWPKMRKSLSNLIWRNGSVMPAMSYSGAYGLFTTSFRVLTNPSVHFYTQCFFNLVIIWEKKEKKLWFTNKV